MTVFYLYDWHIGAAVAVFASERHATTCADLLNSKSPNGALPRYTVLVREEPSNAL